MQPNEQQIYNQQKKLQEQNSAQVQQAKLQVRTEIMEHVRRFLTQKEENIIDKEAIDENARAHQQIYQQNEVFFKALNEKILPVMNNLRDTILQSALNQQQKTNYEKQVVQLHDIFKSITKNKGLDVQVNQEIQKLLAETLGKMKDLITYVERFNTSGCCGKSGSLKSLDFQFQIFYFDISKSWNRISFLKSKEIPQLPPIIKMPKLNEVQFEEQVQQILDKNFPNHLGDVKIFKVEVPVQQIKEVPVEKIVYKGSENVEDRVKEAHEMMFGINQPVNIPKALKIYQEEAQKQNVSACNTLGKLYFEGKHVKQDIPKSMEYYQRSEIQGNPEAMYRIAIMHEKGLVEGKNLDEQMKICFQYMNKAAQKQHLDALTDLGYMYEKGYQSKTTNSYIIPQDLSKAKSYYLEAIKQLYPRAMNNYGALLINEKLDSPEEYQKAQQQAAYWFEKCQTYDYAKGIFNLGLCYEKGRGVPKDLSKAQQLFEEAASKGDMDAKLFYVYYLLQNAAINDDKKAQSQAYDYLQQIILQDPTKYQAYYYLGYLYEHGLSVQKEPVTAVRYYTKASEYNYPEALNKLGDIFYQGFGDFAPDVELAIKYYLEAAKQSYQPSLQSLGQIYQLGVLGKYPNYEKTYLYYLNQASQSASKPQEFTIHASKQNYEEQPLKGFDYNSNQEQLQTNQLLLSRIGHGADDIQLQFHNQNPQMLNNNQNYLGVNNNNLMVPSKMPNQRY